MAMETMCPCCGQEIAAAPLETLCLVVTPTFAEMVALLATRPGQYFSVQEIAAHVWRRKPDAGPDFTAASIGNVVAYNKRRLRALGWDVRGRLGAHGGYRLVSVAT